jgi:hypothetical protein
LIVSMMAAATVDELELPGPDRQTGVDGCAASWT